LTANNQERLYKTEAGRDIATMIEKLDLFEAQREIHLILKSFDEKEQRIIMAGLAEFSGLKLIEKSIPGGSYRSVPRRKTKPF
jgi:hypothetical protein